MSPYYSFFFSTGLPTQYFGPEHNKAPDLIFRFFSYPVLFVTSSKNKFSTTIHLFFTLMFSSNIVLKNTGYSPEIKYIKKYLLLQKKTDNPKTICPINFRPRPGCYVFDFTLFLCSDSYHFKKSPNIFSSASARASAASSI